MKNLIGASNQIFQPENVKKTDFFKYINYDMEQMVLRLQRFASIRADTGLMQALRNDVSHWPGASLGPALLYTHNGYTHVCKLVLVCNILR